MFMEVPPDVALTDFVLDIIDSIVGGSSNGVAEEVTDRAS
jgi:hypothetical protein